MDASRMSKASMAMKAYNAVRQPADDYWDFLEHIEAPRWLDLSVEARLEGTEGEDPWFYRHHVHHETPLEELVTGVTCKSWDFQEDSNPETLGIGSSPKVEPTELKNAEHDDTVTGANTTEEEQVPINSIKKVEDNLPKLVHCFETPQVPKDDRNKVSLTRPSDSFSVKLLSTLMARIRTSGDAHTPDRPLSDSKAANCNASKSVDAKKRSKSQLISNSQSERRRGATNANKENSQASGKTKAVSSSEQQRKPRLPNTRKSMPNLDRARNSQLQKAAASSGRSEADISRSNRASSLRRSASMKERRKSVVRISATLLSRTKAAADNKKKSTRADESSSNKLTPKYEPRLHSTRDIREWEKRNGQQYYSLQPLERVKVNQQISDFKRLQQR